MQGTVNGVLGTAGKVYFLLECGEAVGALVFHAGTALRGGQLVTNGGRILNVTATGVDLPAARETAYAAAKLISWPGVRYRRDIAAGEL